MTEVREFVWCIFRILGLKTHTHIHTSKRMISEDVYWGEKCIKRRFDRGDFLRRNE